MRMNYAVSGIARAAAGVIAISTMLISSAVLAQNAGNTKDVANKFWQSNTICGAAAMATTTATTMSAKAI